MIVEAYFYKKHLIQFNFFSKSNAFNHFNCYIKSKLTSKKWVDEFLDWNPNEYNMINSTVLPHDVLWIPDTIVYNRHCTSLSVYFQSLKFLVFREIFFLYIEF